MAAPVAVILVNPWHLAAADDVADLRRHALAERIQPRGRRDQQGDADRDEHHRLQGRLHEVIIHNGALAPMKIRERYEAKADIGGKLAQLGSRLIQSTARKLAARFFTAFADAVNENAEA